MTEERKPVKPGEGCGPGALAVALFQLKGVPEGVHTLFDSTPAETAFFEPKAIENGNIFIMKLK